MVALIAGEAEETLLQDRVAAIPESRRETQALMIVADAPDAVLAPAVSAQMSVFEREIFPRSAVRAVILADGAPLAVLGKAPIGASTARGAKIR